MNKRKVKVEVGGCMREGAGGTWSMKYHSFLEDELKSTDLSHPFFLQYSVTFLKKENNSWHHCTVAKCCHVAFYTVF